MKTRCGLVARITLIAGLPGVEPAPRNARAAAPRLRIGHPHADSRPATRRCRGRTASRRGPRRAARPHPARVSVSTVRRFMAQRSAGRQSAMRWFQLSLVVVSNAISRMSGRLDAHAAARRRRRERAPSHASSTGSSGVARELRDGAEGAEAPLRLAVRHLAGEERGDRRSSLMARQRATAPGVLRQAGADHASRGSRVRRACPRSSLRCRRAASAAR